LAGGRIAGDDTDGHVDDLSRFFRADGIVTAMERNRRDVNHRPLRENLERLQDLRTPTGRRFTLVELPMPEPCFRRGQRMPASYANFLSSTAQYWCPHFDAETRRGSGRDPGRLFFPVARSSPSTVSTWSGARHAALHLPTAACRAAEWRKCWVAGTMPSVVGRGRLTPPILRRFGGVRRPPPYKVFATDSPVGVVDR